VGIALDYLSRVYWPPHIAEQHFVGERRKARRHPLHSRAIAVLGNRGCASWTPAATRRTQSRVHHTLVVDVSGPLIVDDADLMIRAAIDGLEAAMHCIRNIADHDWTTARRKTSK
jgi:hypothetical protein